MPYLHKVQPGDTLSSLARRFLGDGTLWPGLARHNQLDPQQSLPLGYPVRIPVLDYLVRRGDTLRKIAQSQSGNSDLWQTIAQMNAITNPQDLRIGQRLQVPNPKAVVAAPNPTAPPSPAPVPATPKPTIPAPSTPVPTTPKPTPVPTAPVPTAPKPTPIPTAPVPTTPVPTTPKPLPAAPTTPVSTPPKPTPPVPIKPYPSYPPKTYTVQPGDTLYRISAQIFGDGEHWSQIASLNKIGPTDLKPGMVLTLPAIVGIFPMPLPLNTSQGKSLAIKGRVSFETQGDSLHATWIDPKRESEKVGVHYEAGLFRKGIFRPKEMIDRSQGILASLRLSSSERKIIAAVASNEGNLDAVNTWDGSYLSFGIFQWTLGQANVPGELAALLAKIKQRYPTEFSHYFGQFGLDIDGVNPNSGWLSLAKKRLVTAADKNQLRQPAWAYRFAIAGGDIAIQSIQILHAISRLDQIYFARQAALDGYSLSRLITSEYGVALLLDHHVNRPSYVAKAVAESLWQNQLTPEQLSRATPEIETKLIAQYVRLRAIIGDKPMTHAIQRADRLRALVTSGYLSADRGSFQSGQADRA